VVCPRFSPVFLPPAVVEIKDGHPVTSSLRVAEIFGKQHKNVIQRINALIAECPEEFGRLNFQPSSYINQQGKAQPSFNLTRDGFALLAMGFTGPEALAFKLAYIERFNAMEAELGGRLNFAPVIPSTLTLGEFLATREHLKELRAEVDRLFDQFAAVEVRVTPAEIDALDQPYERISGRRVRTRDLLAMTDAHGVPRKAVEELLGITNVNARQHVFHGRHERNGVA